MESARVRGCVAQAGREPSQVRQADASRRRNGPRKPALGSVSTVRLSRKSCLGPDVRYVRLREKVSSGKELREPQQASVGAKTRSAGRTPSHRPYAAAIDVLPWAGEPITPNPLGGI
ncbi:hypothetical protein GCM10022237_36030 [Nocardioides ginsengisoli]